MKILVTGSNGFFGRNLVENLKNIRDGKDCTHPELKIDEIYEKTGVAWYYGIDEENERILLPRISNYILSSKDKLPICGNGMNVGFTDGTTNYGTFFNNNAYSVTLTVGKEAYGKELPNNESSPTIPKTGSGMGLTTEADKSGMVVDLSFAKNEKIYYIYMVVGNVSIKKSIGEYTEVTTSENDTLPLFTGMYFDFTPNHVSWIKAGTTVKKEGYISAYNELLKISKGEETKYGAGFKIVKEDEKLSEVDYTNYWIINEEKGTFRTPIETTILNTISNTRILIEKKEPTQEDTTWYNLYSDGWLEQGGSNGTLKGWQEIILPKPYANTNYTLTLGTWDPDKNTALTGSCFNEKENDRFYVGCYYGAAEYETPDWHTCGYTSTGTFKRNSENTGLYFKVGNAVQDIEIVNAAEALEAVNNCVTKTECKSYVIETYVNGTSGYRIWSDGYCEQWGRLTTNSDTVYTVNLLKEMEDTNYLCLNSRGVTGNYRASIYGAHDSEPFNFTTTSFDVYGYPADGLNTIQWKVTGYLKEGEY